MSLNEIAVVFENTLSLLQSCGGGGVQVSDTLVLNWKKQSERGLKVEHYELLGLLWMVIDWVPYRSVCQSILPSLCIRG